MGVPARIGARGLWISDGRAITLKQRWEFLMAQAPGVEGGDGRAITLKQRRGPVRAAPGLDRNLSPASASHPTWHGAWFYVENEFGAAPLWWWSRSRPTARNSANCMTFRCRRDPKCRTVHPNSRDAGRNRGSVDRLSCDVAAPLYKRPLFARRVTKRRTRSITNRAVLSSGLERACA